MLASCDETALLETHDGFEWEEFFDYWARLAPPAVLIRGRQPGRDPVRPSRIGLIVPSSNTTMETELPKLFRRQSEVTGQQYTFHSTRARMKHVNRKELAAMVGKAAECGAAVADADVSVIAYACLALIAQGPGAHEQSEQVIARAATDSGHPAHVVSSAGALMRTLRAIGARRVALTARYTKPLTATVSDYIEGESIEISDAVSLEVADNRAVGRLDPHQLPKIARDLQSDGTDAVVLSACVQMPSLPVVQTVEDELDLPVITAATATTCEILTALGHEPAISGAGRILAGRSA